MNLQFLSKFFRYLATLCEPKQETSTSIQISKETRLNQLLAKETLSLEEEKEVRNLISQFQGDVILLDPSFRPYQETTTHVMDNSI